MLDWWHVAAGALTGFVVGLTGVGGGALMTPILLLAFGVAPHTAIGTDLWFAAGTKLPLTRLHHAQGLIDWQVVRRLWTGSLTASVATLVWISRQPVDAHSMALLKGAIAVAVCVTAVGLFLQKPLQMLGRRIDTHAGARSPATWQGPMTVVAGAALGALVTLTSVGAGALGAVLLVYLYPSRLTPPRLIATDIAHAIPLAIFAAVGHSLISHVDLALLGGLLAGSIPAALLGALLSSRLPHGWLRAALATVLLAVGLTLATDVFR